MEVQGGSEGTGDGREWGRVGAGQGVSRRQCHVSGCGYALRNIQTKLGALLERGLKGAELCAALRALGVDRRRRGVRRKSSRASPTSISPWYCCLQIVQVPHELAQASAS